jgi:hypothetical protein
MFQYDYLCSAATCIENTAVLLEGGWISYNCTMSAQHLQVKIMLYVWQYNMLLEEEWILCDSSMGVR